LPSLAQGTGGRGTERSPKFARVTHIVRSHARANNRENKATAKQPPLLKLSYKESVSNERLRVSNWIVQGLYDYAVKKTVEL
jgi:hypothetical protein